MRSQDGKLRHVYSTQRHAPEQTRQPESTAPKAAVVVLRQPAPHAAFGVALLVSALLLALLG